MRGAITSATPSPRRSRGEGKGEGQRLRQARTPYLLVQASDLSENRRAVFADAVLRFGPMLWDQRGLASSRSRSIDFTSLLKRARACTSVGSSARLTESVSSAVSRLIDLMLCILK